MRAQPSRPGGARPFRRRRGETIVHSAEHNNAIRASCLGGLPQRSSIRAALELHATLSNSDRAGPQQCVNPRALCAAAHLSSLAHADAPPLVITQIHVSSRARERPTFDVRRHRLAPGGNSTCGGRRALMAARSTSAVKPREANRLRASQIYPGSADANSVRARFDDTYRTRLARRT